MTPSSAHKSHFNSTDAFLAVTLTVSVTEIGTARKELFNVGRALQPRLDAMPYIRTISVILSRSPNASCELQ